MSLLHDILRTNDAQGALIAIRSMPQYINVVDERGHTPLMLLARRQYTNMGTAAKFINTCLKFGAELNLHTGDNRTALYHAIDTASLFAVRALLRHGPRLDLFVDGGYSLLTKSVLIGDPRIVFAVHKHCARRELRMRDQVTGDTYLHEMLDRPEMGDLLLRLASTHAVGDEAFMANRDGEVPLMRGIRRQNSAGVAAMEMLY